MKFLKKYWYIIFLCVVLVGVVLWVRRPQKQQFREATAVRRNLAVTLSVSGAVQAERKADLMFQSGGRLAWVGVKEGQWVHKWQTVASLDQRSLEKNLQKELNDYLKVRWDFQGNRESQLVTTDNLDSYTLTPAARRVLEKSQFDLNNAVLDVEIQAVAKEFSTIIAPFDGLITRVLFPYAPLNVTTATVIATVVDPDSLYFEARIDEVDIGKVEVGQPVMITLDAYPDEPLTTRVIDIGFSPTDLSGGGTGYLVKISLPSQTQDLRYKLGMNADAIITTYEIGDALTIPVDMVTTRDGKRFVSIREGGKVFDQEISIGAETADQVEVTSGLRDGAHIIKNEKGT